MKTEKSDKRARQALDFNRVGGFFSADPSQLRIVGGANLPTDEWSEMDTDDGPEHTLWDSRLNEPLTETFINNVDLNGVIETVVVAKIDGIATVIAGRRRVRGARAVNARRKLRGEPLLTVEIKVVRPSSEGRMLGLMVAENEAREDDDVPVKILKLKRLMERGVSIETCATHFDTGIQTINNWLSYDDNACKEVKKAVEQGKISQTAGMELSTVKDVGKQREALAEVMKNAGSLGTSIREVRKVTKGTVGKKVGVSDKFTQKRLMMTLQAAAHHNANDTTLAFYEGAEEMLKLVMGEGEVDKRLVNVLVAVQDGIKKAKASRAAKKAKKAAEAGANPNTSNTDDSNSDADSDSDDVDNDEVAA